MVSFLGVMSDGGSCSDGDTESFIWRFVCEGFESLPDIVVVIILILKLILYYKISISC